MFIHIDENECVDLYNICLDIFGCENVRILIWKKINDYFAEALTYLEKVNVPEEKKTALQRFTDQMMHREN